MLNTRSAPVLVVVAIVGGCGTRVCPTPPARGPCVPPYIEAAVDLENPPAAEVTFRAGTPLMVTAMFMPEGRYELAPVGDGTYRGIGAGRVYFARDIELAHGIRAVAGASAMLQDFAGGEVGVRANNGQTYQVSCEALAGSRGSRAADDDFAQPNLRVLSGNASLISAREYGTSDCCIPLWHLGEGDPVDLLALDGSRAEVRFRRDGFIYEGLVADNVDMNILRSDLLDAPNENISMTALDQNTAMSGISGVPRGPLDMKAMGHACSGKAILARGAPLLSGPVQIREFEDALAVREIQTIWDPVEVALQATSGEYRSVAIADPTPVVTSLKVWVRAVDLDRPTCGTTAEPSSEDRPQ